MTVTEDGGKTWDDQKVWPNGFFRRAFGDFRTMWFDPDDPLRILLGSDGGLQFSFDGGHTSDSFPTSRRKPRLVWIWMIRTTSTRVFRITIRGKVRSTAAGA
jgi:hypothetical protein